MLAAATAYLERDDPGGALIETKVLLQSWPDSAEGRLMLVRIHLARAELQAAEEELKRADALNLPAAQSAPMWATLWLAQRKPAQVVERFRLTAADPSAGPELPTLLAQAYRDLGQAEPAQQTLETALKRAPGHVPGRILAARLAAESGQADAAREVATELVAAHPALAEAWLLHGDMLALHSETRGDAIEAYRKALQRRARFAEAHVGLVMALLQHRDVEAARAQLQQARQLLPGLPLIDYLDALAAFMRGDFARARERTEHLLATTQPTPQTLLLAGMTQARIGNPVRAEALLAGAVSKAPRWTLPRRELAALQIRVGRPAQALHTLKPALEEYADDADLWALAGQTHARLADFRQADAAFARAAALRPADIAIRTASARLQIARGRVEPGLRELEAAALADRDGIEADLALVAHHMLRGQRAQALAGLEAIELKRPAQALSAYLRGRILQDSGERAGARLAYEAAQRLDPRSRQVVDALVALDLAEQKPAAARQRYEALLKLEPKSAPTLLAMAELLLRSGAALPEVVQWIDRSVRTDPLDAGNWRAAIDLQRRLGDPAATLARALAAQATLSQESDLLFDVAGAQLFAGELEPALATLNRLVQQRPQSAEAHLLLAMGYGVAGRGAAARAPLNKALELAPDAPAVLRAAVSMALSERDPERARRIARQQQQRAPLEALGWELQGEIETALKNADAAVAAYRIAHARRPAPERAVQLHRALLAADPQPALQFELEWLKAEPTDALFLAHLAEVAQGAGRAAEAEARYRQALKLQPDNVLVLNNLAELLTQRRQPEGLALAERAVRLQPQWAAVQDSLASALAVARQFERAVQAQRRAVELQPRDPLLRLHLAQHLIALGDEKNARQELRRLAALDGAQPVRAEATRLLQAVGN